MVLITPGEQCTYADVYEWQPRVGRPFTYPMFASPGGKHLEPLALHEQGIARRCVGLAAGHARVRSRCSSRWPTRTASTPATVFGELLQGDRDARIAAYRDPEWRAAGGRRPGELPDEAALGDVRGLRVVGVPRAAGSARDRARSGARLQPARRDVRAGDRRGSRHALPRVHRQRRRRRRRPPAQPRERRARSLGRGRARRPAVRRAAADRPARHLGAGPSGDDARARGAQADRRAGRPLRLRAPRLPARGLLGRRVRVRSADRRAGSDATGARLPGRRRTADGRGADRRAARPGQRHADPGRRITARRLWRRGPACDRRPPDHALRAGPRRVPRGLVLVHDGSGARAPGPRGNRHRHARSRRTGPRRVERRHPARRRDVGAAARRRARRPLGRRASTSPSPPTPLPSS